MENKSVGWLILGISALFLVIVYLFNNAATALASGCPALAAGYICPAHNALKQEVYLSIAIVGVLALVGIILIFSKPYEKIIIKRIKENNKLNKININSLRAEDKQVFNLIKENKAIFQADIIDKTGFGKAKVTRIIDRLEGNGFVERKRRGMTNIVVLK